MATHIVINGREVTNPVARFLIGGAATLVGLGIAALVVFGVLPFVGVVVTGSLGFALVLVFGLLLALPVFIFGAGILALLLSPLFVLFGLVRGAKDDRSR